MESTLGKLDGTINVIRRNIIRVSNGLILRILRMKIKLVVFVTLKCVSFITLNYHYISI